MGLLPRAEQERTIEVTSGSTIDDTDRDERITQVVEDVARRRANGEQVSDESIVDTHPDLAPELVQSLRALRRVAVAQSQAKNGPATTDSTSAGDPAKRHSTDLAADSFPGCEIVDEVYRGGQGVVYRAKHRATGRDVAIKVMHQGLFPGSNGKGRFDREVRILAQLKHPNIVTIYDSGTSAGPPRVDYFVMDWIEGQALDTYVATRKLAVDQTLRLFAKICEAVNAAHLRGIIHRDLKPSNILVDGRGEPQILDFGLAKPELEEIDNPAERQAMTATGQFVGSLPWASPEQAAGLPDQIDLRADVYALGVVVYHMLTGEFPYNVVGNMRDVLNNILEAPPARPSEIREDVDDEVETIVLKCLAKEPEHRYQSAGALADDVQRYLTNQPILARAPSTMYQLRKLAVRHKLPCALAAVVVALLIGVGVWRVVDHRKNMVLLARALEAEQLAEDRRALAAREAETSQAINEFLINDMLASVQPGAALGRKITVEEVLENA